MSISTTLSPGAQRSVRRIRDFVDRLIAIPYHGNERFCPVCKQESSQFRRFGIIKRDDAQCPHCGVLERHRLVRLYFQRLTNLFDGKPKKMLHVAPERPLEVRLRDELGEGYLTADLLDRRAMVQMDITDIQYPDQTFDVIYCSHVLEHVPDDKKAMREFHRVLKNDGWAILLVPITSDSTYEDASITSAEDRLQAFGQDDHVRRYGPDYADRLREAGFQVKISKPADVASSEEIARMGLTDAGGEIYYCTK